jgi:hypothetical protein
MTIRNRIPLKANKKSKLAPGIRTCLQLGADMVGELDVGLTEEEIQAKLVELWKIHREEVLAYHIGKDPGSRPAMFWRVDHPDRPIVHASDGSVEDGTRERTEQRRADVLYLREHGLLTEAEEFDPRVFQYFREESKAQL